MNKFRELAGQYMKEGRVMQLGTLHDNQPRVNSLYYVASDDLKSVYWLSEKTRRHSIDIDKNNLVGGAIVIKQDLPVVGLQFEGEASEVLERDEQKRVIDDYTQKYGGATEGLYKRIVAGNNKHHLYKVAISRLEMFDDINFPNKSPINVPLD